MTTTLRTRIIAIGNSRGIRLPRPVLEQSGLGEDVELEVERDQIVIRPAGRPRQGWDDAFRAMAEQDQTRLLIPDSTGRAPWDDEDWEW